MKTTLYKLIITLSIVLIGLGGYAQKTIWSLTTEYYYDFTNPDFGITDPLDNFYTMFYFHDSAIVRTYDTIYGKKKSFGIVKFDVNGNEKWAVTAGADDSIYMADMVADSEGNVYFYLYSYKPTVYITNKGITDELTGGSSYLVKLNSNGELDWYKAIKTNVFYRSSGQYFYTSRLVVGENKKVYLFAQYQGQLSVGALVHNQPVNTNYGGTALIKLNTAGDIVRISNFITDRVDWKAESTIYKAQYNPDRGEIDLLMRPGCYDIDITGDRYNNVARQYIISIDTQGNNNKVLPIEIEEGSAVATTFERLPDRDFVIGFYNASFVKIFGVPFTSTGSWSDIIIMRISEDGVPKWRKEYHGNYKKSIWDIKLSKDKKYIYTKGSLRYGGATIEGKYIPMGHRGDYLAKYDLNGNNAWFYYTHNGYVGSWDRLAMDSRGDIYFNDLHSSGDTFKFNCYENTDGASQVVYLKIRDGEDELFDTIPATCINKKLELIPKETGAGYVWSTGETTPTIKITGPGTYYLSIDTGFCSLNGSITIDTLDLPVEVDIGQDIYKCPNAEVELTAQTNALKYQWSNDSTTASIQVTDTGYYSVMVDSAGCVGYDTVYVGMDTLTHPFVSLGKDAGICEDDSIKITVQTQSSIVSWSTGNNDVSQWITDTGTYYIVVDSLGCIGRDTLHLKREYLTIQPITDTFYCEGSTVDITYKGSYDSLEWGDGSKQPFIAVDEEGTYKVTIFYEGCRGLDTLDVYEEPLPQAELLDSTIHCFGETPYLTLNPGAAETYQWSTGEQTPTIQVSQAGTYTVVMANKTCEAEDEIEVTDFCQHTLYTPNAFNPNSSDPNNRVFKPVGNGIIVIKLSIYNRWGEMIHYQEGPNAQWDGTYKGAPVMQGQYMYVVTYRAKTADPDKFAIDTESGYLMLLR